MSMLGNVWRLFTNFVSRNMDIKQDIEYDLLVKKIRRLVFKLKKYEIQLHVFEHKDILEYGEVLGKGGEGIVQKCIVMYNGLPVEAAVKTVTDNSDDALSICLEEIELLCLAHDSIFATTLQVYGIAAVPDKHNSDMGHLVIIMEPGIMNCLQLYADESIPLYVTYDLWARLASGVFILHSKKIIHQDLKPENILITQVNRGKTGDVEKVDFKIIDMGMAKRLFTDKIVTDDIVGTNGYHPPEVLFEDSYDFKADIFMLGITFCVMLHSPDFLKSNKLQTLLNNIHEAKHKRMIGVKLFEKVIEPTISEGIKISSFIKSMICQMLQRQGNRKISLVHVIDTCRSEAMQVILQQKPVHRTLTPCITCQDSGFGSEKASSGHKRKTRNILGTRSPTSSPEIETKNRRGSRLRKNISRGSEEIENRIDIKTAAKVDRRRRNSKSISEESESTPPKCRPKRSCTKYIKY